MTTMVITSQMTRPVYPVSEERILPSRDLPDSYLALGPSLGAAEELAPV